MQKLSSLERFQRLGLAHLPTPFEPMARLSAHLAKEHGGPRLWVKRDDCTGVGLGGNKLRKLDYVLKQAIEQGADTLVSGGVVQSNSQRQVAAAAAKLGLACHLAVYHGRLAPPSAEYEKTGNALLNRLFGATLHDVPWNGDRNGAIRVLADRLRAEGRQAFCRALRRLRCAGCSRLCLDRRRDRRSMRGGRHLAGGDRALHGQRRHAGRAGGRRALPACQTRASSASTSTPSPSGCGPMSSPTPKAAADLLAPVVR